MIDINKRAGYSFTTYPDGQLHVTEINNSTDMIISIQTSDDIIRMLQVASMMQKKKNLYIRYLWGGRSDKLYDGSRDVGIICDLINSLNFEKVMILEPHSEIPLFLIDNSIEWISPIYEFLNNEYDLHECTLIIPDAGSYKKLNNILIKNEKFIDKFRSSLNCYKYRSDGVPILSVQEHERIDRAIIVDDLCDGGRTFNTIAQMINAKHKILAITHAIFSHGIKNLEDHFDMVITTDSYIKNNIEKENSNKLKRIKL